MSGIVGIINLDGAPVDRKLLECMTDFMSFRGPDAQEIWIDGNVGFGHTMLRTTFEAETEQQPLTLDGKVWLTADARIDGRAELIAELEAKLRTKPLLPRGSDRNSSDSRIPNDAELILYAYQAWGEDCVKHLIGDFAFAIWDSRERRLFCARDHFGVRPFYYAHVGNAFVFSNTLKCLRLHPKVSGNLDDAAVGDFLLFGLNNNLHTTVFSDIKRLPPAHYWTYSSAKPQLTRYWTLPVNGQVPSRSSGNDVAQFKELLNIAVEDRLRIDHVGVFMSGGLDSTTVAATARSLLAQTGRPFSLQAYTTVYEHLIPDSERHYAGLVAQALDIPINYLVVDDYKLFERCEQTELRRAEPVPEPLLAIIADQYRQVAHNGRVVLSGHGPDAVLSTFFPRHLRSLINQGQFVRGFMDTIQYAVWNRRLPPIGVRTLMKRKLGRSDPAMSQMPSWINPDFVNRLSLEQRFRELSAEPDPIHGTHPVAYSRLTSPYWTSTFELDHADVTFLPVENRYPFFDVRLITYLLSIHPIRWCIQKRLLRVAMRGILPEAVRHRPKSPLAGDVLQPRIKRGEQPLTNGFHSLLGLNRYVIPPDTQSLEGLAPPALWTSLRLLSFCNWMSEHMRS